MLEPETAIKEIKRVLRIMIDSDTIMAAGPVSLKLVDCIESITAGDRNQFISDLWAAIAMAHKILCDALVDRFNITDIDDLSQYNNPRDLAYKLKEINKSIVTGTHLEPIFKK